MDLKTNKRNIMGILIITLIFGAFSIISMTRMFNEVEKEEALEKKDYIVLLEEEFGKKFDSNDDFINFSSTGKELLVEPVKYQYYFKPCFDFVIEKDGVRITGSLAKEFYELGLAVGMKITHINGETLKGKGYFDILDLLYSKNINEKKTFVFNDQSSIEYTYSSYNDRYDFDEEKKILYVYNLDIVTPEVIYELYLSNPEMVLDLSKASVNTYSGVKNFVSMFSIGKDKLFKTPANIVGNTGRKIEKMKIVIGDNSDDGVLFALTAIQSLNSNINIVENINDIVTKNLNTTTFLALKELKSSNYTIYVKNYLMETKSSSNGEVVI